MMRMKGLLTAGAVLVVGGMVAAQCGESGGGKRGPVAAAEGPAAGGEQRPAQTAPEKPWGPEVVTGPDEPNIPGGAPRLERFALCGTKGISLDGRPLSSAVHDCRYTWFMEEKVYVIDHIMSTVNVVEGGRYYRLAGTGRPGDAEGPAEVAEFHFGTYAEPQPKLIEAPNGDVYVADARNGKVKKIFKKDGRLFVRTVAGGGKAKLGLGQTADGRDVAVYPNGLSLRGKNRGHLHISSGRKSEQRFLLYPDGKIKCVGQGKKTVPLGIEEPPRPSEGFTYRWKNVGSCTTVVCRVSRRDGAEKVVVGIPKRGVRKPVDGPVTDCSFFLTGGPMRPDGRAMYTCGGDESVIRRIMNGKVMTLQPNGKWVTNRDKRRGFGYGNHIRRLGWDGYAYLGGSRGKPGIHRLRLYAPLKKSQEKGGE